MPDPREDDLFRSSTMTFGEHLEELRTCLFKSLFGLAIGFVIGLIVGQDVVVFLQRPLTKALTQYYRQASKEEIERLSAAGASPWTLEQVEALVEDEGMLTQQVYVDPAQLLGVLKAAYPEKFKDAELPPSSATGSDSRPTAATPRLLPLFLWHRSDDDARLKSKGLSMSEPFSIYVKASLLVGVLLSSPWIFYQIWHFVAAGLYPHERRYVHRYLPVSLGLFLAGAALAFFVVFEPVLNFLLKFSQSQGIIPEPRINEWLSFVLILPLGFGIGFQLPLVMLFLERIGVFTVRSYLAQWRVSVLVIAVLAAILTPPDPYSMLLLALPLMALFFGGILLCKFLPRSPKPFDDA